MEDNITRIPHDSLENDQRGLNTNSKGGNRPWKVIFAWFREINVLNNDFSHESAITFSKTYESTKRVLIQTRRGEPDYGEHNVHAS